MALILGKQHVRGEGSRADEGHGLAVELDGGLGAFEAGQLAFLIGDVPAAVPEFHRPPGDQLNGLRLLLAVALASLNGKNHVPLHRNASTASRSSSSTSWE